MIRARLSWVLLDFIRDCVSSWPFAFLLGMAVSTFQTIYAIEFFFRELEQYSEETGDVRLPQSGHSGAVYRVGFLLSDPPAVDDRTGVNGRMENRTSLARCLGCGNNRPSTPQQMVNSWNKTS